jgi:hypothetical protein
VANVPVPDNVNREPSAANRSSRRAMTADELQAPRPPSAKIERVVIDEIYVSGRRRSIDPAKVAQLADSMKLLGLLQPITVREEGRRICMVAGRLRLAAAESLGWTHVDAVFLRGDTVRMRLAEIAENLHRVELTRLERGELEAEWVRLTAEQEVSGKDFQKPQGGRPEGGTSKAARELPIPGKTDDSKRKHLDDSIKINSMSAEAKAAAREVGLDNNRTALIAAAKETGPKKQVEALKERAKVKALRATAKAARVPSDPARKEWHRFCDAFDKWGDLPEESQKRFLIRMLDRDVTSIAEKVEGWLSELGFTRNADCGARSISDLQAENRRLGDRIAELGSENHRLADRVAELEAELPSPKSKAERPAAANDCLDPERVAVQFKADWAAK